jgi:hypothetical protein
MNMPGLPKQDECFLCNQPIRFSEDDFEVVITFTHLPMGAKGPSAFLWAHDACAREAADRDFAFPHSDQPD